MRIKDHQISSEWRQRIDTILEEITPYPILAENFNQKVKTEINTFLGNNFPGLNINAVMAEQAYGNFDVNYQYKSLGPVGIIETTIGDFNRIARSFYHNDINTYDSVYLPDTNKLFFTEYIYDDNAQLKGYKCREGEPKPLKLDYDLVIKGTSPKSYDFTVNVGCQISEVRRADPSECYLALDIGWSYNSSYYSAKIGEDSDPVKLKVPMYYNTNGQMILDSRPLDQFIKEEYINKGGIRLPVDIFTNPIYHINGITIYNLTGNCNLKFNNGSITVSNYFNNRYIVYLFIR